MRDIVATTAGSVARRAEAREFLAFRLGDDFFGVELQRVREIVTPPPLTPVPRAPSDIIGVCSVRGLLVTVVDLRLRLDLTASPMTRQSRILLARGDADEIVGLLVDEVRQVVRLPEGEIELAQQVLGGDLAEHVVGIGRPADGRFASRPGETNLVILLDLASVIGG